MFLSQTFYSQFPFLMSKKDPFHGTQKPINWRTKHSHAFDLASAFFFGLNLSKELFFFIQTTAYFFCLHIVICLLTFSYLYDICVCNTLFAIWPKKSRNTERSSLIGFFMEWLGFFQYRSFLRIVQTEERDRKRTENQRERS